MELKNRLKCHSHLFYLLCTKLYDGTVWGKGGGGFAGTPTWKKSVKRTVVYQINKINYHQIF